MKSDWDVFRRIIIIDPSPVYFVLYGPFHGNAIYDCIQCAPCFPIPNGPCGHRVPFRAPPRPHKLRYKKSCFIIWEDYGSLPIDPKAFFPDDLSSSFVVLVCDGRFASVLNREFSSLVCHNSAMKSSCWVECETRKKKRKRGEKISSFLMYYTFWLFSFYCPLPPWISHFRGIAT